MNFSTRAVLVTFALTWMIQQGRAETKLDELAKAPAGKKLSYGSDPLQFGELTLPEGPGPHPVVINVHGGCWLAEYNIDHSRALANALAKDGIAVWNLEYRRVGNEGGGWPGTFLDVGNGADHLRTLSKEYPLDLSRVVAVGHSAGGYFALWLGARHKIPAASEIHRDNPLPLLGVVALAPASELDALHPKKICGNVVDRLMGGSPADLPDRYRSAMPSAMLPLGIRQTVIVGKRDRDWTWVGESYRDKVRAAGEAKFEFIEAPESGHFEVIDPNSSTWPLVRQAVRGILDRK